MSINHVQIIKLMLTVEVCDIVIVSNEEIKFGITLLNFDHNGN